MLETAKDQDAAHYDINYGNGIVKAKAAFEDHQSNGCDSDEAFQKPKGRCTEVPCTMDYGQRLRRRRSQHDRYV